MDRKGAASFSTQLSLANKRLPETPPRSMASRRNPAPLSGQPHPQFQQQPVLRANGTSPPPSTNSAQTPASGGVAPPISPGQVVALVRDALKSAGGSDEARPGSVDGSSGITLDLTGKKIPVLPNEVIDILRNGVERLALSHNALSSVPTYFSQCSSLRYLAARNNAFDEFPLPLCELTSLEFLDLGRNRLRRIPQEIAKLGSLKALALQDNRIESLPLALASMTALQRLRLSGNPIKFPPRHVLQPPPGDQPSTDGLPQLETIETVVTAQIKNFLAQRLNSRLGDETNHEGGDDEAGEGPDTPRVPTRRAAGRFPVRVRGATISSPLAKSPSESNPPPIPGRSHFRAFSQASTLTNNTGTKQLSRGKPSEGLRSTSVPPNRLRVEPRSESRSSRRKASVAPVNEVSSDVEGTTEPDKPKLNRFSNHLRGFSYSGGLTLTNPFSPEDPSLQRPLYVRELPAVPVRQYGFQAPDPILEVAKGILYSIFQIHVGVQTLMSLANDGSTRRSSLEMVFYNTNVYFEELEQAIQDFDLSAGTKSQSRNVARGHESMQRAYSTLINAYVHICAKLMSSVDLLVDNGDERYMRSFLMGVWHSITELRATLSAWISTPEGAATAPAPVSPSPEPLATISSRPPSRAAVAAALANNGGIPSTARLGFSARRPGKVAQGMQVRTDIPYTERSQRPPAKIVVSGSVISEPLTPSSDESFTSAVSSPDDERNPGPQLDMISSDGDRQFERFFVSLKQASELVLRTLPGLNDLLATGVRQARSKETAAKWESLLAKSGAVLQQTEILKERLSTLKLRDPGLGVRSSFWVLCNNLFGTWAQLGDQIKLGVVDKLVVGLPQETIEGLRNISRSMKDSIDLMVVVRRQAAMMHGAAGGVISAASPPPPQAFGRGGEQVDLLPLPMTPQSAALGPAYRATKPLSEASP